MKREGGVGGREIYSGVCVVKMIGSGEGEPVEGHLTLTGPPAGNARYATDIFNRSYF